MALQVQTSSHDRSRKDVLGFCLQSLARLEPDIKASERSKARDATAKDKVQQRSFKGASLYPVDIKCVASRSSFGTNCKLFSFLIIGPNRRRTQENDKVTKRSLTGACNLEFSQ